MSNQSPNDVRNDGANVDIQMAYGRERTHNYVGSTVNERELWTGSPAQSEAIRVNGILAETSDDTRNEACSYLSHAETLRISSTRNQQNVGCDAVTVNTFGTRIAVGADIGAWCPKIVAEPSLRYSPGHVHAALPSLADGDATLSLSRAVPTSVTLANYVTQTEAQIHMRGRSRLSANLNNVDATGFAAQLLARTYAHNSAIRYCRDAKGRVRPLRDDEPTVAGTWLCSPTTMCIETVGNEKVITGLPHHALTDDGADLRRTTMYNACLGLVQPDVLSAIVRVDGLHSLAASDPVFDIVYAPTAFAWIDIDVVQPVGVVDVELRQVYAFLVLNGVIHIATPVTCTYAMPQVVDAGLAPAERRWRYHVAGIGAGLVNAAAFLLGRPASTDECLPGTIGWTNRAANVALPNNVLVELGSAHADTAIISFTPREVAAACESLIRGFALSVGTYARASMLVSEVCAQMTICDFKNGSLANIDYEQRLPPIVCFGIQFFGIGNMYGGTDARQTGRGDHFIASVRNTGMANSFYTALYVAGVSRQDLMVNLESDIDAREYVRRVGMDSVVDALSLADRLEGQSMASGNTIVACTLSASASLGVHPAPSVVQKMLLYGSPFNVGRRYARLTSGCNVRATDCVLTRAEYVNHRPGVQLEFDLGVARHAHVVVPVTGISPRKVQYGVASYYERCDSMSYLNMMRAQISGNVAPAAITDAMEAGHFYRLRYKYLSGGFGTAECLVANAASFYRAKTSQGAEMLSMRDGHDSNALATAVACSANCGSAIIYGRLHNCVSTTMKLEGIVPVAQMAALFVYAKDVNVKTKAGACSAAVATSNDAMRAAVLSGTDTISFSCHTVFTKQQSMRALRDEPTRLSVVCAEHVNAGRLEHNISNMVKKQIVAGYYAPVIHVAATDNAVTPLRAAKAGPGEYSVDDIGMDCLTGKAGVRVRRKMKAQVVVKSTPAERKQDVHADAQPSCAVPVMTNVVCTDPTTYIVQKVVHSNNSNLIGLVCCDALEVVEADRKQLLDKVRNCTSTETLTAKCAELFSVAGIRTLEQLVDRIVANFHLIKPETLHLVGDCAVSKYDGAVNDVRRAAEAGEYSGNLTSKCINAVAISCMWFSGVARFAQGALNKLSIGKYADTDGTPVIITLAREDRQVAVAHSPVLVELLKEAEANICNARLHGAKRATMRCRQQLRLPELLQMPVCVAHGRVAYVWQFISAATATKHKLSAMVRQLAITYASLCVAASRDECEQPLSTVVTWGNLVREAQRISSVTAPSHSEQVLGATTHYIISHLLYAGSSRWAYTGTTASDKINECVADALDHIVEELGSSEMKSLSGALRADSQPAGNSEDHATHSAVSVGFMDPALE